MNLYERIQKIASEKGCTISDIESALGFGRGSIYKYRVHSPSVDKIQKIASYLCVSVSALLEDEPDDKWYYDPDTAKKAQEIFENKEMSALFDAARDCSPENLQVAIDVLLARKRREQYNGDDPC